MLGRKIIGQTKDSGFQVGARKTFPVTLADAWEGLFSEEGLVLWLGEVDEIDWIPKTTFTTKKGLEVKIRLIKPLSHVRLSWKPANWDNSTLLQIRTIPGNNKTTISFHQDQLTGSEQREEMKAHWKDVLQNLSTLFTEK